MRNLVRSQGCEDDLAGYFAKIELCGPKTGMGGGARSMPSQEEG